MICRFWFSIIRLPNFTLSNQMSEPVFSVLFIVNIIYLCILTVISIVDVHFSPGIFSRWLLSDYCIAPTSQCAHVESSQKTSVDANCFVFIFLSERYMIKSRKTCIHIRDVNKNYGSCCYHINYTLYVRVCLCYHPLVRCPREM